MKSGKLDRRITIQQRAVVQNTFGEEVEGWTDVFGSWARVEWSDGGESLGAGQRTAAQTVKFHIRFRAGVEPKMRVVYDGENYDIQDVQEGKGRRDELIITAYAREVTSGA